MASTAWRINFDNAAITAAGLAIAVRGVTSVTRRVYNRANVLTPVRTGRLRAANQMRVGVQGLKVQGEVFNDTAYAAPVHDGSKAYVVRPRRKKALRFVIDGEVVFARSARIPARRGRPWIYRAMLEVAAPLGWKVTRQ